MVQIVAGKSVTDVALFFGVHNSAISRLWKLFQTSQTVVRRYLAGRPMVAIPAENRYITVVAKQNRRSTPTRVASMIAGAIGKDICHNSSSKATLEWFAHLGTTSLSSFICPIQRDTTKVVPPTCELDCAWLEQRYAHRRVKICSTTLWLACKGLEKSKHTQSAREHHRTSCIPQ